MEIVEAIAAVDVVPLPSCNALGLGPKRVQAAMRIEDEVLVAEMVVCVGFGQALDGLLHLGLGRGAVLARRDEKPVIDVDEVTDDVAAGRLIVAEETRCARGRCAWSGPECRRGADT